MDIPEELTDQGIDNLMMAHLAHHEREKLANHLRALQVKATMRLVRDNSDTAVLKYREAIAKYMQDYAGSLPLDTAEVVNNLAVNIIMGVYEQPI